MEIIKVYKEYTGGTNENNIMVVHPTFEPNEAYGSGLYSGPDERKWKTINGGPAIVGLYSFRSMLPVDASLAEELEALQMEEETADDKQMTFEFG